MKTFQIRLVCFCLLHLLFTQINQYIKMEKDEVESAEVIEEPQPESNELAPAVESEEGDQSGEEKESKWEKIQQPEKSVPLFMVDFEQCDSKKCTGKKMERFKLLVSIKDKKKKFKGIVLSAFGKKMVSREDLEHCVKYGICVIDCSWNRIEETREFRYKHERKLPFVVAGNPVNFGKPYQLSCVEAMATSLCSIGYIPQAKYIMSKFGWSDGFWKQNPNILRYGDCTTKEEIEIVSKESESLGNQGFIRNYDIDSEEEEVDDHQ